MRIITILFSKVFFIFLSLGIATAQAADVVEVEPNDVTPTALDNHDRGLGAIFPAITDIDEWSLHGGSVGDLVFFAIYSDANGNPDTNLTVYNNDGFTVIETDDDDAIGKQSAVAGGVLQQSGKVFFNIHDETNNQAIDSYQVCGVIVDPDKDGADESESNDDPASADDYSATVMFGDLGDGTADYYQFSASAGDPVMVIVDDNPDNDEDLTDTDVDLLGTDGSTLLSGGDDGATRDANATEFVVLPEDGTYYVRIQGGGPDTDYSFVVCGAPQPSAAIGDFVWDDRSNKNGIQDDGEAGINGLKVYLIEVNDDNTEQEVDVTTTGPHPTVQGANGWYEFPGLHDDKYRIRFEEPTDIDFTLQDQGGDDAADSDADESDNGKTPAFVISNHVSNPTLDAGLIDEVEPAPDDAVIGDLVFKDLNGNGLHDGNPLEPGIAGVTVNLRDPDDDSLVATATTNIAGVYSFIGVSAPDNYYLQFVLPANMAFTIKDANANANDNQDSDADPITGETDDFHITPAETDNSLDAGMVDLPGSIGDFVWDDVDRDGVQDGGEPGIDGVTVNLIANDGIVVLDTTMTAGGGAYQFSNLSPGGYFIEFEKPADKLFTSAHLGGDDTLDSDANSMSGRSPLINLAAGEDNDTVDAGLLPLGTIGDFVWLDLDEDGRQDAGEPGIEGVEVKLLDAGEIEIDSTTTSTIGAYSFMGLVPGDYFIEFALPDGHLYAPAHVGANDAIDSDADETTGRTTSITLGAGEMNLTVDAGFIKPIIPPCKPGPDPSCDMSHLKGRYIQKGILASKLKLVKGNVAPEDLLDASFISLCVWFDEELAVQSSALADSGGYELTRKGVRYKNKNNPLGIVKAVIKPAKPGSSKIMVRTVDGTAIPENVNKVDVQVFNDNGCWGATLNETRVKVNKLGIANTLKARKQ